MNLAGLVNNAGIAVLEPAESTSEESMERFLIYSFIQVFF